MTRNRGAAKAADRVRVRLYDADGRDRDVPLGDGLAAGLGAKQLLWIDVDGRAKADLERVASAVGVEESLGDRLAAEPERAALKQHPDFIHLVLIAMDASPKGTPGSDGELPEGHGIDLLAGKNWILTVHDGPLRSLDRIEEGTEGETKIGALDAAGFLAAVVDEVLVGYFDLVEETERQIDRLDELALMGRPRGEVLQRIVRLRVRIGQIRRTLMPHRAAFAALARPEMELHEELGRPWPALPERLERAIEAVEGLRDLLLGTFDIHMARAAQDANIVMKRLTLLSAVLLPAVVLAGIMGMNFKLEFFETPNNFWLAIAVMVALSVAILGVAKLRDWL